MVLVSITDDLTFRELSFWQYCNDQKHGYDAAILVWRIYVCSSVCLN